MRDVRVTVIGGSGFIGRNVVRELAKRGAVVSVGVRDLEAAKFLKPMGAVGQVTPVKVDLAKPNTVSDAIRGADMVVNLVGILFPSGTNTFQMVQAEGPGLVARAAAEAGVKRLVHVSAIGADEGSRAVYAKTKAAGEKAVRAAFPGAVILRPSVVFGPDDDFFNRFGAMAETLPFLPLVGGGLTKFQPVYVEDVAQAVMKGLTDTATTGGTYELGGPTVYTFKELMRLLLTHIKRKKALIELPYWAATLQATFLQFLPKPPLTPDQVELLKSDNVVSSDAKTLADLGIEPTPAEVILPTYLDRFRPGGRYNSGRVPA